MRLTPSRLFVAALMALSLAACNKPKLSGPITDEDMSMGNPAAKVTVIEYASAACPHCAKMNNEVFPAFKAKYIDTGKIHYVFREFLVGGGDEASFAAAAFLTARCAGKDKYFGILDAVFRAQAAMYQSGDIRGGLLRIAEAAGLTEAQFNACVSDEAGLKALNDRTTKYAKDDGIDSTPTFVINGKKLVGEETLDNLGAAIAAAQTAK